MKRHILVVDWSCGFNWKIVPIHSGDQDHWVDHLWHVCNMTLLDASPTTQRKTEGPAPMADPVSAPYYTFCWNITRRQASLWTLARRSELCHHTVDAWKDQHAGRNPSSWRVKFNMAPLLYHPQDDGKGPPLCDISTLARRKEAFHLTADLTSSDWTSWRHAPKWNQRWWITRIICWLRLGLGHPLNADALDSVHLVPIQKVLDLVTLRQWYF